MTKEQFNTRFKELSNLHDILRKEFAIVCEKLGNKKNANILSDAISYCQEAHMKLISEVQHTGE